MALPSVPVECENKIAFGFDFVRKCERTHLHGDGLHGLVGAVLHGKLQRGHSAGVHQMQVGAGFHQQGHERVLVIQRSSVQGRLTEMHTNKRLQATSKNNVSCLEVKLHVARHEELFSLCRSLISRIDDHKREVISREGSHSAQRTGEEVIKRRKWNTAQIRDWTCC